MSLGFTFKENYWCKSNAGTVIGFNQDEALNACNADPQCMCVDYSRTGGKKYMGHSNGTAEPRSGWDLWVITVI